MRYAGMGQEKVQRKLKISRRSSKLGWKSITLLNSQMAMADSLKMEIVLIQQTPLLPE
jgi:hypothetical protein